MGEKTREAIFWALGMVVAYVYVQTDKLWLRLAALLAAVLVVLLRERYTPKQVYYQMLRSSMLYAVVFGAYLLNLPFPEEPIVPPHIVLFFGVIATVYFVLDFAKLHRAHEKVRRRRQA